MIQRTGFISIVLLLLCFIFVCNSVKIGISKPVVENTTTEAVATTNSEPSSTAATKLVTQSTKPQIIKTTVTTPSTTTKLSTSTTTTTSTSPIPPTTTTAPVKNNDKQPSPIRNENVDRSGYFCSCDMRPHFCDINCCCDIDCTPMELNSFDCKREETRLEDFYYQQGLPPCKIHEGWLCVFRTNIDESKQTKRNYLTDANLFHVWPELILENNNLVNDRNNYKIGDPILLYNFENNEITEYDLPFSFAGHHCQIEESVRHLEHLKTSCNIPFETAKDLESKLIQKLCTSFILQAPNTQVPLDGIIREALIEFISISLYRCNEDFDCILMSTNGSSLFDNLDEMTYSSLIRTRIHHNITNLVSCDVFFIASDRKSDEVWQNYEVNFIQINETEEILHVNVSGPLGYNAGSPLIVGHKVLLNESADNIESNQILNYFHPNRTEKIHIHTPRRRQDKCEDSQSTVNFGESILVQCSIQLDNSTELSSETNFTKICDELQIRSMQMLQSSDILALEDDYFVSILGHPEEKSWVKIELKNYDHLPVLGVYLAKEDAFVCRNMILGLKFEFFTLRDNIRGIRHQNLLRRASVEMGKRHDLQFQLDELVSIPITFAAVFYDLQQVSQALRWASCFKIILGNLFFSIFFLYK